MSNQLYKLVPGRGAFNYKTFSILAGEVKTLPDYVIEKLKFPDGKSSILETFVEVHEVQKEKK